MPLPDPSLGGDNNWPPTQLTVGNPSILSKLQEWSAWYAGDADQLARTYGGFGGVAPRGAYARPSQYAGGVTGAFARFFWGSPQPAGQARTKIHMPVASDIATASADLLFAEPPTITMPKDATTQAVDRMQQLLDGVLWDAMLLEQGELNSALGGVYLRAVYDREVEENHPLVTAVHADAAVPEFSYGRLKAVTFWQVIKQSDSVTVRLLERHEQGRIEFGLYEGTKDKLGRRIPLTEHAETRDIAVDAESGQATGIPWLTATYVPNMKPNRTWRTGLGADLGRSDYAGTEPLMDSIDETMTSWMRDIRLGKGRVIVPAYMLQNNGIGKERTINLDQEVFTGLALPPAEENSSTGSTMTVQQFQIRTQEHADTVAGLLAAIYRGAGYSSQTFGLVDESAATATEVTARERRSYTTREKKTRYYSDALARFLRTLFAVDSVEFGGGIGVNALPRIEFPAAAQPSPEELARSVQMLRAAQLLSADQGVRMVHPDWDDEQVAKEVARIAAEKAADTPVDPYAALPGQEGGGQPVDGLQDAVLA